MGIFKYNTGGRFHGIFSETINTVSVLTDFLLSRFGKMRNGQYPNIFAPKTGKLVTSRLNAINTVRFPFGK